MIAVSIILPIYNPTNKVFETIDSVINQSFNNWELIIVDDNSKVNIQKDIEIKYPSELYRIIYKKMNKNIRAAACRNFAVSISKGKYIAFIDQDDLWDSKKISKQYEFLEKENYLAVHSNLIFINNNNEEILSEESKKENDTRRQISWDKLGKKEIATKILLKPNIRLISSMVKKDAFLGIEGFKAQFFGGEDEIFWFQFASKYKIGYINEILLLRREHRNNTVKTFRLERLKGYYSALNFLTNQPCYKSYSKEIRDMRAIVLYNLFRVSFKKKNMLMFIYSSFLIFVFHPKLLLKKL